MCWTAESMRSWSEGGGGGGFSVRAPPHAITSDPESSNSGRARIRSVGRGGIAKVGASASSPVPGSLQRGERVVELVGRQEQPEELPELLDGRLAGAGQVAIEQLRRGLRDREL